MNWIQRHILLELVRYPRRRYSELRPDGVEGNLFLYHLDGVMKDKMVEKVERKYQLTDKGLRYVATLSLATGRQRQQPQVLTAVVCRNEVGEFLLSRWRRQPNAGLVSLPHGMVHYGQGLREMAEMELAEKAGLVGELSYRGEVGVRAYRGGELDRHMLVHIFEAAVAAPGRMSELRPDASEAFWARLDDISAVEFVPGFYEIARMFESSELPALADIEVGR